MTVTLAIPALADHQALPPVIYVGVADWWGRHVWLEQGDIRTRLRYSDGSVIAFAWGRAGLGARELARSILHDATGKTELPDALYGCFAHEVIAALPEPGFVLARKDVIDWLARQGSGPRFSEYPSSEVAE